MKKILIAIFILISSSVALHAESITINNRSGHNLSIIKNAPLVLMRVKECSGMHPDLGEIKIVVFKNVNDLFAEYKTLYGKSDKKYSWYDETRNTIFTYPGCTLHMLAHEFGHAIWDKEVGVKLSSQTAEMFPNWVEQNVNLKWMF